MGLDLILFESNLMPRVLLGYRLIESLSDQLKKAERCVFSEDIVDGHNCILIEAYNNPFEDNYSQNLKAWIDTKRDYRPLKIDVYHNYNVGDSGDLDDGLYFTREGIVAIKLNKFVGAFNYSDVKDKFGEVEPLKGKMNYVRSCSDEPAIIKNIFNQLKSKENSQ